MTDAGSTTDGTVAPHREATRQLIRQGSAYTASRAAQFVAGVLIIPIVTRLVSQAEYGRIGLAMLTVQILGLIGTAGLPAVITREYYASDEGIRSARRLISLTGVIAVAVGTGALLTGPLWVRIFDGVAFDRTIQLAILSAVAGSVMTAGQSFLQASRRVGRFAVTALIGSIGAQAIGLAVLEWDEPSASAYMLGYTVAVIAAAAVCVSFSGVSELRTADRPFVRRSLAIALPTVPHSLGLVLLATGDRFVIERVDGLSAVGQYQAAYALGGLGLVGLAAFNNAWAPLIHGAPELERWDRLAAMGHDIHRLVAMGACVLTLAAPWLLEVLLPADYDVELLGDIASVVAFASIPYVVYLSNVHVLFQQGRTAALAFITPASVALNVGANLVLLPITGIRGAAFTTLAGYSAQAALVHLVARRQADVPWVPSRFARWTVLAVAACGFAYLAPLDGLGGMVRLIALAVSTAWLIRDIRRALRHKDPR